MTDSSMFGNGVNAASFGGGADAGGQSADVTPPPSAPPPSSGASFGSSLRSFLPGPSYTAPDPAATALDQTADTLQQRVQRANSIASNPVLQFFDPDGVAKARAFVPAATEQLQKIKAQKADMQANRTQAETLGLAPGEVPDEASQADRVTVAQSKALKGDLKAFQGLQAVDPQAAAAIQDRVHEAVGGHLSNAQLAFDSLSGMQNQGQYAAKLNQLRQDGTLTDLETLGMKVPKDYDSFNASKGAEGKALREAKIAHENLGAKLEERANGTPMEKKEAETYAGRLTTESGQELNNGTWSRVNGKRVFQINGAGDIRDLGTKYNLASPDQRKAIHEDVKDAIPTAEMEKNRAFNRTYKLATEDAKGNKLPDGAVNTNPNVQQGMAEGLASMLRGGAGGANVGLLKIETGKRGYVQGLIDKIKTEHGATINELKGADINPYLSKLTQGQIRDVMEVIKGYNDDSISNRTTQIAKRAGELGLDASALGLGKGEVKGVDDAIDAGRQSTIDRFTPRHRATGGGDGGIFLDNPPSMLVHKPDAGAPPPPAPPPVNSTKFTPSAAQAPQQGTPPAPQPGPAGGAPVQVAGQQVNVALPPGASPQYVNRLQRIESGNEASPWTAGTDKSSASGAFQFINGTWASNKPPGAPNRAGDATPAQQAQALATLTTKNAATLTNLKLPVTDTTLYMAHNLGAGGASSLLSASPMADARTVVGDAAASNNPMFFKGRPTVATVLKRYQDSMEGDGGETGPKPKPEAPSFMQRMLTQAQDAGRVSGGLETFTPQELQDTEKRAQDALPAIGSTVGAVGGSLLGPGGTIAGGAAGGAAGQALKDRMQGRPFDAYKTAKEGALGGVLGIAPEARPLLGAAARVAGVAGVEGGVTAAEGGDAGDVADSALKGGAYALGGEVLGRFISSLGPAAHKVLSNYLPGAQQELSAQAGKLADARKVLETEQPKLPGGGDNPAHAAAKKTEEDAKQYIKDHGQNPDDMVYAYEHAKAGTSAGEALTLRKANAEKSAASEGYDKLRQDMRDAGVGAPKPNQPLPDGPTSMIRTADNPTGKAPEQFRPEAEHAEMLIKAPAKDWGDKWAQLQNAGTELIQKRMSFLQNADKPSADAMDALFQGVRNQQKAAAEYVFGKEAGAKVISHLEGLDTQYAKVMNATQGMNYEKMRTTLASGNTPAARDLEKNFKEFAKDDPGAIRAFNAMKAGARGDWKTEAALMGPVIAGEVAANLHGVPTVGAISAIVGGHRLYKMVQGYMNAKVLGTPVKFKDFLAKEIKGGGAADAARVAAQRGALQTQ